MKKTERATKTKLEEIVPKENLDVYWHIYKKMRGVEHTDPFHITFSYRALDKKMDSKKMRGLAHNDLFLIFRDLNKKMDSVLKKAYQHYWLSEEERNEIRNIWHSYCGNRKDRASREALILNDLFTIEGHRPTNFSLHFLVHALAFDLKLSTGRTWHDRYIADFLSEYTQKKYTAGNIKKKLEKHTANTILEKLAKFQRYYLYAAKQSLLPNYIPEKRTGFLEHICRVLDIPAKK